MVSHIVYNVKTNLLTNRRLVITLPFYFFILLSFCKQNDQNDNKIMMCGLIRTRLVEMQID